MESGMGNGKQLNENAKMLYGNENELKKKEIEKCGLIGNWEQKNEKKK